MNAAATDEQALAPIARHFVEAVMRDIDADAGLNTIYYLYTDTNSAFAVGYYMANGEQSQFVDPAGNTANPHIVVAEILSRAFTLARSADKIAHHIPAPEKSAERSDALRQRGFENFADFLKP